MRGDHRHVAGEPCLSPIKMSPGEKSLLSEARAGNLPQMRKRMRNSIFKKPEDINQRDERFCTPLHYAAKNSHIDMIKFIVDKGGDISATDKHGWSVLQYAVRYGTLETVELLVSLGCDLTHKEKKGWNSLHLAARNGHPDKARYILEHGVDVNETQDQGWNALHLAVRYGQPDTISTLLEYGIDINAVNAGWTPLHLAALNGHTDLASILLNKGAAINVVNEDGKTAMDIAREEKHDRIVAIILEWEFQTQTAEDVLPSPPPTPPSAPPFEFSGDMSENQESLQEWQSRLREELESFHPANSAEDTTVNVDGGGEDTGSVRNFAWKTFDEEALELLHQLEKLRMQEVDKVKAKIIKCKKEFGLKSLKFDKQRHLLEVQIDAIQANVLPALETEFQEKHKQIEKTLVEIQAVLTRLRSDTEAILSLKSQVASNTNPFAVASGQKSQLVDNLVGVHRLEINQTESRKAEESAKLEQLRAKKESDIKLNRDKMKMLSENIEHLKKSKADLEKENVLTLEELATQLERAERKSHFNGAGPNQDENWFGCPVCLLLLKPPMRIFQCPEGHILCEECKENPSMVHCPQCRCPLEGQCSRNRALEEVARSYYPMAPSGTL